MTIAPLAPEQYGSAPLVERTAARPRSRLIPIVRHPRRATAPQFPGPRASILGASLERIAHRPADRQDRAAEIGSAGSVPLFHMVVPEVAEPVDLPVANLASVPSALAGSGVLARALCATLPFATPAAATTELDSPRQHDLRRDRRAYPRRLSGCTVAVCRKSHDQKLTPQRLDWLLHASQVRGQLIDVSMNGLAFQLSEAVSQGEELLLRVCNRHLDRHVDTVATVARVTESNAGEWTIHCRLNTRLTFEQVQQLGQQLFSSAVV